MLNLHQVPVMLLPIRPCLFLIDGYALIYRAFYALISRPLRTSRGENTSAAWGVVTFLNQLLKTHVPEYLGWVHDSGLSFRQEQYPAYKATREKLTEELQADFDRGMERITQLLEAYRIPILTLPGYEADDVIGSLARQAAGQISSVVVVSGDKDFQQLIGPNIWLLNPGRGGPAGVEEQWIGMHNASDRLGVPPGYVTDYLALVGDTSDNVPGVPGIGDKTARDLVGQYGDIETILAVASRISNKRVREALVAYPERARLSKQLVTIRDDLGLTLDLESLRITEPDHARLQELFIDLEFHSLARGHTVTAKARLPDTNYVLVDNLSLLTEVIARVRSAPYVALDVQTVSESANQLSIHPLRSTLVSLSIAIKPGEVYYFPLQHRQYSGAQYPFLLEQSGDHILTGELEANSDKRSKSVRQKKPVQELKDQSIAARALGEILTPLYNLPPISSVQLEPLREMLEDSMVKKTTQNAKHNMLALRHAGVVLTGLDFDITVASYVLDPGRRSHSLGVLVLEFLNQSMTTYEELCGKGHNLIAFTECPLNCAMKYSCEQADMMLRLRGLFEPQLQAQDTASLFHRIEMPLVDVLADMEWSGISIDVSWFSSLKRRFRSERAAVEHAILEEAGMDFNINSNPQLRHVLFEKLQLPVLKRTPSGPSTDASVLQELADSGYRLPSLLMEYRELSKLESTYLDTLPSMVDPVTGRIHTSFNQTVATTGRLSSSDPNLQNIPVRRELGRAIRRGFIPRKGWLLLSADYSQIELRLLAHLSEDAAFVGAFCAGGDIHRQTAAIIFGTPIEAVTAEMRARAKTINFATIYGQGPHALSRQLRIDHTEAKQFIADYFERFEGVRMYLNSMVAFALEHGYVKTIFGRRRYIPELRDRNFNMRAFGERTAANSPIQGSAADLIKLAMIQIRNEFHDRKLMANMLLQVHDELVFEVLPEELEEVQEIVRDKMTHAAELSVPLVVDIGIGENWLNTKYRYADEVNVS